MGICETADSAYMKLQNILKKHEKNLVAQKTMFDHHVGCFGRALATNANNNQSNIVNVGLKPMLYHVCFMYGCEALLDVTYLVCCLMKIHVHLKRVNRRGGKSLEDQGGNRWGA